ncbi:hypothetical protein GT037_001439 [Alternaria burnsii]|uniref:Uncharacterized protein n=1 Tax=Alternaria burnsii TaxID=1187904 RepID=A0A8H7EIA3_9PLEO|nr:uncharacterized protein GT037_001439 [Alternaria burnsii]KAF7679788.1 hypothetical protein GT037_001439 [Alternaria burnsii]
MEDDSSPPKTRASSSDLSNPSETRNRQVRGSLLPRNVPAIDSIRKIPILPGTIDAAVVHLTIAIRAAKLKAEDALNIAIAALKNLEMVTLMKAAVEWIRLHPWETAALVIPVVLMACTPAFLGLVGFTASGVAAGSIAAGIQAGIGSVAAGSVFATLTSAAMAGYGAPIVFGSVWGVSSAVCWGFALWKKWKKGSGHADDPGHANNHTDGQGVETTRRIRDC